MKVCVLLSMKVKMLFNSYVLIKTMESLCFVINESENVI